MHAKSLVLILITFAMTCSQRAAAVDVDVEISRVGDSTHLEFSGSASWTYDLKDGKSKKKAIALSLPDLTKETVKKLKSWKDPLISSVDVKPGGVDGSFEVTFKLANKDVRSFDYLTDQPSRLIIDFFVPDEEDKMEMVEANPVKPATEAKKPKVQKAVAKKLPKKVISQKVKVRRPAGVDFITAEEEEEVKKLSLNEQFMYGIYDGGDPDITRFRISDGEIKQEAIRVSKQNFYLHFPMLDLGLPHLKELRENKPEYEIIAKETEENKVARLLIALFKTKKHAMFNKTIEYFRKKFPESEYNEIISYLEADLHYDRWMTVKSPVEFANAMAKYRILIEKYPRSPLAERTFLLVGYSYLEKDDTFGALKTFQRFLRLKPKTKFKSQVEIAIAKTLLKMNRYGDSLARFTRLSKKASSRQFKVEAEYARGDVLFKKGDYKGAIKAYKMALKKYPNDWHDYPNVFFNMGESMFWRENYKDSIDTLVEFLKRYPSNNYGGYAMTRIGELLEILGADSNKVMGAFLESYFRYRSTQGGDLARVRILTARMGAMKQSEVADSMKEMDQIIERSELSKIDQFVKIKIADGYHDRGEFDNGIDVLTRFYQNNPTKINKDVFASRIVRNIASKIKKQTDAGEFIKAMAMYNKYKKTWLKNSNRIDIIFDQGRNYEQAGVYDKAAELYREALNKYMAIKGTAKEKERSAFEITPTPDQMNLRIAAVNLKADKVALANTYLKEIKKPKKMTEPQQVELVVIAAKIAEERGQDRLAIQFINKLVNTWKGQPELVVDPYIRVAKLYTKQRQFNLASNALKKVENLIEDTGQVKEEDQFRALMLLAQTQEKQEQSLEAAKTYQKVLDRFSSKKDLQSTRYHAGEIYFRTGDYKAAEKVWAALKDKPESVWHQLASEKLSSVDWSQNYSKYIKRIPAMKNFEKREK